MYGLKHASRLVYDELKAHLTKYDYHPDKYAPNIWRHKTRKTKFRLCVEDFGIQYFSNEDIDHLIRSLEKKYTITKDFIGKKICGLDLQWNYTNGWVDISMDNFVTKTLTKLHFEKEPRKQFAPHKWITPIYGHNQQFALPPDNTELLDKKDTKYIQQVVGSFLYYSRAIDNTIITALSEIVLMQAKPTEITRQKINMLLQYLTTYPNARIRFYASDMILYVDSDVTYLITDKGKSRLAGYFYCSNKSTTIPPKPRLNEPVHVECKLLCHIVTSAAEAETAGLFVSGQKVIEIQQMLNALGHTQKMIPIKTDNATAASFVKDMLKQKRSKAWDMRYHWLSEQQNLKKN